jgi:hypothetical protein
MYLLFVTTLTVDRTQKVKDARKEAAKEIEAYKAQKEKEFNEFASKVCFPPYDEVSIDLVLCYKCLLMISILDRIRKLNKLQKRMSRLNSRKSKLFKSRNKNRW